MVLLGVLDGKANGSLWVRHSVCYFALLKNLMKEMSSLVGERRCDEKDADSSIVY